MKFRIFDFSKNAFEYHDINFESVFHNQRHFSSLYHIGTYNEIELYEGDVIKVNGSFYTVRFLFSLNLAPAIIFYNITIKINKNPILETGAVVRIGTLATKGTVSLDNFELIGNLMQINNLKL